MCELLAMIDNQLLTSVENAAVKNHLMTWRGKVAEHREKARALHGATTTR